MHIVVLSKHLCTIIWEKYHLFYNVFKLHLSEQPKASSLNECEDKGFMKVTLKLRCVGWFCHLLSIVIFCPKPFNFMLALSLCCLILAISHPFVAGLWFVFRFLMLLRFFASSVLIVWFCRTCSKVQRILCTWLLVLESSQWCIGFTHCLADFTVRNWRWSFEWNYGKIDFVVTKLRFDSCERSGWLWDLD